MAAPVRYLSGRQQQQKIGIEGSTQNEKVLEVVGQVGIGTTIFEPSKQLDVRGDVIVSGELTVGDTTFGEDFSTRNLSVSGVSTFTGAIDANGSLDVDGHTELDDVNVSGASTFTGAIDANGDLDVDGHTELDDVNVSGAITATTFTGNLAGTVNTAAQPNITSLGTLSSLTVSGVIDANGNLDVDGHTELDDVNVSGASTFTGAIDANGDLDVDGHTELDDVNISGILTATTLDVTGGGSGGQTNIANLNVTGVSTFASTANFNGDIDVDGHTELDNLNVSGVSTFVGVATFSTNDVYVAQRLFVGGVEVGGTTNTFAGINTFTDTTDNTLGNSNTGAVQLDGGLGVDKNVTIGAGLSVAGNAGIGSLNVAGVSTFVGLLTVTSGDVYIAQRLFVGGLEVEGSGSENTFTGINTFTNQADNTLGDTNTGSLQGNGGLGIDKNASFGSTVFVQNAIGINSTAPIGQFDVNGHTELDDVNVSGAITATTFTGNLAGTVNTAAQPNITSLGTLSSLVVSGITSSSAFADFDYLQAPFGSTVTFTVTVASKDATHRYNGTGSGSAYLINGVQAPFLTLTPGRTYRFTNNNTGSHPFKFYLEADKTTEYTSGVNFQNSYTEITVSDETPTVLHYQCTAHGYMGNAIQTNSNVVNTNYAATLRDSLTVSGNINANGNIVGDNSTNITGISGVTASTLTGTLQTAAQPNITSVGTLTGLDVNGHSELDDVNVSGASTFTGAIDANGSLDVDGHTELDDVNVSGAITATTGTFGDLGGAGRIVFNTGSGTLDDDANLSYIDGTDTLNAVNLDISGDVDIDGHTELDDVNVSGASTFAGAIDANGGLDVSGGSGLVASSAKISDLTDNRIVIAGASGELGDTTKLTFDGSTLTVVGDASFNGNVTIGGTLTSEDKTNVDSIGLVTARSGVRISAGGLVVTSGVSTFTDNIIGNLTGTATTATNLAGGDVGDIPYQSANGTTTFVDATGVGQGLVLLWNGSAPIWSPVSGASGNFGGITLQEEGSTVGSAGSVIGLNFVGDNITATAPSGIANGTVTLSDTPTFDSLKVTGITTIPNVSGVTTFSDIVNVGTGITFYASSGIVSATKFFGSGENLTDLINQRIEGIRILDEGVQVGSGTTFTNINFVGNGVVATGIGTTAIVTITDTGFEPDAQENLYAGTGAGNASDADTCYNVALGLCAGYTLNSGDKNVFLGYEAGKLATSGENNVYIGCQAGEQTVDGSNNVFLGHKTGHKNTDGGCGIAMGFYAAACRNSNTGIFIGRYAGHGCAGATGVDNVAIGNEAGKCGTTGTKNVYLGCHAGLYASTGSSNIFLGACASGGAVVTGNDNISLGTSAGKNLTSGASNIILGLVAGQYITNCNSNVFAGNEAGRCSDGGYNLYFGYRAGKGSSTVSNNTGGHNIAAGMDAGCSLTSGTRNVFLGLEAGKGTTTGCHNVFLGQDAGRSNTTGCYNIFFGKCTAAGGTVTGGCNVAMGRCAGYSLTSGKDNVFFGYDAGYNSEDADKNVFIGQQAGCTNTSGDSNIAIGCQVSLPSATGSCQLAIGNGSNRWIAGDSSFNVTVSTASTFSNDGLNVTGVVTATTFSGSGASLTAVDAATLDGVDSTSFLRSDAADVKTSGNLRFNDDIKATFGNSDDVEIYYNQSNNKFRIDADCGLQFGINGEKSITAATNGNVELYYDDSKKLETTTSGVTVTGGVNATGVVTATDFNSTSDAKLKTNVQVISDPLDKIVRIDGVSFNWIENNKPSMGVIADNIEEVLPELVSDTDPKTVNYNGLIGLLIEVVKDQQTQINSLNERLSQLE